MAPKLSQRSVVSLAEDVMELWVVGHQKPSGTNNDQDLGEGGIVTVQQYALKVDLLKSHIFSH